MSRTSQDSLLDLDRLQERTRHTAREPSPHEQANERAETVIVAVGAVFGDERESLPRPNSLDLSEGEDAARDPSQVAWRNRVLADADDAVSGRKSPSRSPGTPKPTPPHVGTYIQPSDISQVLENRERKVLWVRTYYNREAGSQSSIGTSKRKRRASDTSNDEEDGFDERGRSITPTPYHFHPQSHTPSHHSQETEEEHGEGQGPLSPNPWSSSFPYNAEQRQRTEAIAGVEQHFPVRQQQPVAE